MANDTITDAGAKQQTLLGADELVLNMGPQHPSTHGVLRVKLKLDGERVIGSECMIGYLHRGVEKIAEHRSYQQFAPYVDRMDYVAAVSNGLGYCEAIEKLLVVEAPPRARIFAEISWENTSGAGPARDSRVRRGSSAYYRISLNDRSRRRMASSTSAFAMFSGGANRITLA